VAEKSPEVKTGRCQKGGEKKTSSAEGKKKKDSQDEEKIGEEPAIKKVFDSLTSIREGSRKMSFKKWEVAKLCKQKTCEIRTGELQGKRPYLLTGRGQKEENHLL